MVSQAGALALAGLLPGRATRSPASSPPARTSRSTTTPPRARRSIYVGLARRARARAAPGTRTSPCATSPRSARCRAWRCSSRPREHEAAAGGRLGGRRGAGPGLHPARLRAVGAGLRAARGGRARARPRDRRARGARRAARRRGPRDAVAGLGGGGALAARGRDLRRGRPAVAARRRRRWLARARRRRAGLLPRQPLRRPAARATPCSPRSRGRRRRPRAQARRRSRAGLRRPTTRCCAPTGSTPPAWPSAWRRAAVARMTHVLFWDIDGTLLSTARAGRVRARGGGARGLRGERRTSRRCTPPGSPTREVARAASVERGGAATPARSGVDAFLRAYERHLPERLHWRAGRVMPGVARDARGARRRATTSSRCC